MAGRTFYATGEGSFSTGREVRAERAAAKRDTRAGKLRLTTEFGTTTQAPKGTISYEQAKNIIKSGDIIKNKDGTTTKVSAANKEAVLRRISNTRADNPVLQKGQGKVGTRVDRGSVRRVTGTPENPKVTAIRGAGRGKAPVVSQRDKLAPPVTSRKGTPRGVTPPTGGKTGKPAKGGRSGGRGGRKTGSRKK